MTPRRYPRYRVVTGPDDDRFCYRVSDALDLGYVLHGSPVMTVVSEAVYVARALVWTKDEQAPASFRADRRGGEQRRMSIWSPIPHRA
jgi:hypothetical protein